VARTGHGCLVCGKTPFRANLCQMHYTRMRRHGHFDQTRPEKWGEASKHPLWQSWKSQVRSGGREDGWVDFWQFVKDVGQPEGDCRLYRLDVAKPWGAANFVWRPIIARGVSNGSREAKNAYMREWRSRNHGRVRSLEMKRARGMSIAEYDALLEAQGGGCAICGRKESDFRLAIDHNHETGANRGLLCSNCNRGLGLFADDPARIDKAAVYLRRWGS